MDEELTICWSVTTRCNMNCSYCFSKYDCEDNFYDMSENLVEKVLDKLKDASKRYSIRLVVLGGEPTLFSKLNYVVERCENFCRKIVVVTNGTNVEVLKSLCSKVSIDLSYHGQDVFSFISLVESLRENHFVQILCPLDERFIKEIYFLNDYCLDENIFFEVIPIVDNDTEKVLSYKDSIFSKFPRNILYKIPWLGVCDNIEVYFRNKKYKGKNTLFYCKQPNIAIYPNGWYYPCCTSGLRNSRRHIEDDTPIKGGCICYFKYCCDNRGCLDFSGWRQDPNGFLFGNNE